MLFTALKSACVQRGSRAGVNRTCLQR